MDSGGSERIDSMRHDLIDAIKNTLRNHVAIIRRDTMAAIRTIQPRIRQAIPWANANRKYAGTRDNPVQRNRTVRLGRKFRQYHSLRQRPDKCNRIEDDRFFDGARSISIPVSVCTFIGHTPKRGNSHRFGAKQWGGTFEASVLDILEQSATGRIIEYDPATKTTRVVAKGMTFANGVALSVDLSGANAGGFVGYRAKRHTGVVDIDRRGGYAVGEFWEPIAARPDGSLILDPGEFYILASKEAVQIPPDYAAEMVPFDPLVGEFRVHYAGFFDPGFGYAGAGGHGSRAVLEVRSREVPFILEHGQIVGRLVYEKMLARPDAMYGQRIGSNYQAQGLKLSKHFKV